MHRKKSGKISKKYSKFTQIFAFSGKSKNAVMSSVHQVNYKIFYAKYLYENEGKVLDEFPSKDYFKLNHIFTLRKQEMWYL